MIAETIESKSAASLPMTTRHPALPSSLDLAVAKYMFSCEISSNIASVGRTTAYGRRIGSEAMAETIIPRWEWRTFAKQIGTKMDLEAYPRHRHVVSSEI